MWHTMSSSIPDNTNSRCRASCTIDELATAVSEAVVAARDTTKEINQTAKELKERGVIKDTAANVETTVVTARER
jgi:hypothetical protein